MQAPAVDEALVLLGHVTFPVESIDFETHQQPVFGPMLLHNPFTDAW